jgi:predicted enzyme related to lactoylglutathione lyase
VTEGIKTIVYPVGDIHTARILFGALVGREPDMDQPYYVGWRVGDQDIGLDPNGHRLGMTGPLAYWHVSDLKGTLQSLLNAGAKTQQDVKDVGGGKLIATVTDADGNTIGLIQSP